MPSIKNGYINPAFQGNGEVLVTTNKTPVHRHNQPLPSISAQVTPSPQESKHEPAISESADCGLCCCKPICLNKLAHPISFVLAQAFFVLAQSILVSGYIAGSITTIEKRFNFSSVESGAIVSSYEVTCIVGVILVSYFGAKYNRSRWLSYGAFIIAIGSFLFVLPHAIGGLYVFRSGDDDATYRRLCYTNQTANNSSCLSSASAEEFWAMAVFIVSMLIIGFGAAPVYTLGPTYLYDNCKRANYGIYIGIVYCCGAIGPAAGFMLSALTLTYYVDLSNVAAISSTSGTLTESSPGWLGAWWLGFIVCGFLNIIAAIPLLFFPARLPAKFSSDHTEKTDDDVGLGSMKSSIREVPSLVCSIFRNLAWLFVSLCAVMEASVVTGFVTFIAKFLQVTYGVSASKANIVSGGVVIPGACSGIMLGGYLMKRFKLSISGVAKMCCLVSSLCLVFYIGAFFMGCDVITLAGVTVGYPYRDTSGVGSDSVLTSQSPLLQASCNVACMCSADSYAPVCGADHVTYYNPCYAGCTIVQTSVDASGAITANFSGCACVHTAFSAAQAAADDTCPSTCGNLIPLLILLFIIVVLSSTIQNPGLLITLSCVEVHERSFALGLQSFLIRVLAYIPAPIYFGYLFDSQCLLWQESCGVRGACLEYNKSTLPFTIFGMGFGLKVVSLLFTFLIWLTSRHRDEFVIQSESFTDVGRTKSVAKFTAKYRGATGDVKGEGDVKVDSDVVDKLDKRLKADSRKDTFVGSNI